MGESEGRPPRRRWRGARAHLTPVAEGGTAIAGAPELTFRTAPLGDLPLKLWEECGCDYPAPTGPKSHDPAWAEWTEEPPRTEGAKQSLRWALTRAPGRNHPGGLLGPNFYQLGHFHSGDARREQPGFPDLTIWTPLGVPNEVWELKKMDENPSLPQAHHMTALEAAGFTVRTVRPCCLLSGWVDRWLARLSGKTATLSEWAPDLTDAERLAGRQRAARTMLSAGATTAAAAEDRAATTRPARRLAVVADPPGQPVPDDAGGRAEAYLVPMPAGGGDAERAQLEGWLRDVGFAPIDVPWPMRIVVGESLVVVWVNTGEPGTPGNPRPRCWRSSYPDKPFPAHVVRPLGGAFRSASSVAAAMSLLEAATAAADLTEETR
jgi:hypothetical protein